MFPPSSPLSGAFRMFGFLSIHIAIVAYIDGKVKGAAMEREKIAKKQSGFDQSRTLTKGEKSLIQHIDVHRAPSEHDALLIGVHEQVAQRTAAAHGAAGVARNGIAIDI